MATKHTSNASTNVHSNVANPSGAARKRFRVALDGPSALMLYRNRDDYAYNDATWSVPQPGFTPIDDSEYAYLSDEDIAATLADTNVFGHHGTSQLTDASEARGLIPAFTRSRVQSFKRCTAKSSNLKLLDYDALGLMPPNPASPLYLLMDDNQTRHRVRNVHVRSCTNTVPQGSLQCLGENVLVPKPELTFLLLARHLSLIELIMAGMEMCGHYRMVGATTCKLLTSDRTIYGCDQLTTPSNLKRFLERVGTFPGRSRAERACKYIATDSASPMETNIYLLLCLPRSLGGYALPQPTLNAKRPVNALAESFTFAHSLIPDLYWASARLDMEYDSDEFHADPECLEKGARRTMALRAMHVDVISMTADIVYSEEAFAATARLVARRLGARLRSETDTMRTKRRRLRFALLSR